MPGPKKGKGLTIGILLGKGPKGPDSGEEPMGDSMDMDDDNSEEETEEELPPGLVEAVAEFRTAESDDDAAKAFHRAIQLCGEY